VQQAPLLSFFVSEGVQQTVVVEGLEQQDDPGFTSCILVALFF
jgi:hypothetical protein